MSTSSLITDYVGSGTFANRPATPPIAAGATAFYFATDTIVLYAWTGAGWVIVGSGTGGSSGGLPTGVLLDPNNGRLDGFMLNWNDQRTFTASYIAGGDRVLRATSSKAAGKWYFEAKILRPADGHFPIIGIATQAHSETTFVGGDATAGAGYGMGIGGSAWTGNAATSGLATYAANDILGVAVDFTAATGSVTFYKNNVSNKVYGSLTLGTLFPAVSCRASGNANQAAVRFAAADCTYAPPAGYSNWS